MGEGEGREGREKGKERKGKERLGVRGGEGKGVVRDKVVWRKKSRVGRGEEKRRGETTEKGRRLVVFRVD